MCGRTQGAPHRTQSDCIDALRDYIAALELQAEQLLEETLNPCERRRSNNRFVILNGKPVCLSDAARQLGISLRALRLRIQRRVGTLVDMIDLGEIDIATDKRHARTKQKVENRA